MKIVTIKFFLVSTLIFFLLQCAGTRKAQLPPAKGKTPEVSDTYDESFDPLSLQDEDLKFPERRQSETSLSPSKNQPKTGEAPGSAENRLVEGFRVQLLATKDIENATIAKQEAELIFSEDSVNVYIEFDSPYYKVRIGDCKTREEAERLRALARERGYDAPWIVKSQVWSNPKLSKANPIHQPQSTTQDK